MSGASTDQTALLMRLLVINGVFILSVFSMVASLYLDRLHGWPSVFLFFASLSIFSLSLIFLLATLFRGVAVHGMTKMDAWWWLSAPYSAVVPLSALVFHIKQPEEIFMVLALLAYVTTASSIVWLAATIYQLTISKKIAGPNSAAMMGVVVLAGILWSALIALGF